MYVSHGVLKRRLTRKHIKLVVAEIDIVMLFLLPTLVRLLLFCTSESWICTIKLRKFETVNNHFLTYIWDESSCSCSCSKRRTLIFRFSYVSINSHDHHNVHILLRSDTRLLHFLVTVAVDLLHQVCHSTVICYVLSCCTYRVICFQLEVANEGALDGLSKHNGNASNIASKFLVTQKHFRALHVISCLANWQLRRASLSVASNSVLVSSFTPTHSDSSSTWKSTTLL